MLFFFFYLLFLSIFYLSLIFLFFYILIHFIIFYIFSFNFISFYVISFYISFLLYFNLFNFYCTSLSLIKFYILLYILHIRIKTNPLNQKKKKLALGTPQQNTYPTCYVSLRFVFLISVIFILTYYFNYAECAWVVIPMRFSF